MLSIFMCTIASKINATPKVSHCQYNCNELPHSVMKFDRSNKFDLCYYGQVNSLWLKSNISSTSASKTLRGCIYFAGDVKHVTPFYRTSTRLRKSLLLLFDIKRNVKN